MDLLMKILRLLAVLLYGASGIMKVFLFEKASEGVPSFAAMPRRAWTALGILELACVFGLMPPANFPRLVLAAASLLAAESLVFVWVHAKYRETGAIALSAGLGLLMAFIAYWQAHTL